MTFELYEIKRNQLSRFWARSLARPQHLQLVQQSREPAIKHQGGDSMIPLGFLFPKVEDQSMKNRWITHKPFTTTLEVGFWGDIFFSDFHRCCWLEVGFSGGEIYKRQTCPTTTKRKHLTLVILIAMIDAWCVWLVWIGGLGLRELLLAEMFRLKILGQSHCLSGLADSCGFCLATYDLVRMQVESEIESGKLHHV